VVVVAVVVVVSSSYWCLFSRLTCLFPSYSRGVPAIFPDRFSYLLIPVRDHPSVDILEHFDVAIGLWIFCCHCSSISYFLSNFIITIFFLSINLTS
jgi:hypothetical protein